MKKIKILLADDHQIVLDGLKLILNNYPHFEIIGEKENGKEVLDFIEIEKPDVLITDINMPVMDGITCSKKIKEKYPEIKIIILTMYSQKSFIKEIVSIGIDGCLLKNNTGKELGEAVERVVEGKSYYDQIRDFNVENDELTTYKLSDRETDIIRCLSDGLSSNEIAEKLFISIHTVRTHRKNILKKLNLHNTPELIQYGITKGIIG